jgi:hypothetical protein
MDKIIQGLLAEFSSAFQIGDLPEDEQFENFASYLSIRRHYGDSSFDLSDVMIGSGGDGGIDASAVIINGALVTDVDDIKEIASSGNLRVEFVFVQAERSQGFSASKIGNFGFGVSEAIDGKSLEGKNDAYKRLVELISAVYASSSKFKGVNPSCCMYYVTTGQINEGDPNIESRIEKVKTDLKATGNLSSVEFRRVGSELLQKFYAESKNTIERSFSFPNRTVIEDIDGVKEAHIGYVGAKEFLKLVCDEDNAIIPGLFYDNVRDWEGYNKINQKIQSTLESEKKDRFVLMNNGVTIIGETLLITGNKCQLGNYQIVNGCQTSNVLADNIELLTDAVRIPVRIICTTDEAVKEAIIEGTNSQTEVKQGQFFALKTFARSLENYFRSGFDADKSLYYERRSHQYDSENIPQSRIVTHQNLVRAMGAMFLNEPHRTTRNYKMLAAQLGERFFCVGDKPEPYYASAYAAYKLNPIIKAQKQYRPGFYHILLTARLLVHAEKLPQLNANKMSGIGEKMIQKLWKDADEILTEAITIVDKIANGNWDRDHIRTQQLTEDLLEEFNL